MKEHIIQIIISVVALILLVLNIVIPAFKIEPTSLALLVIAIIPWTGRILKSIEIPGFGKIELQEKKLEKIKDEISEKDLFPENKELNKKNINNPTKEKASIGDKQYDYPFQIIEDQQLALASLRIELETKLKELIKDKYIATQKMKYRGMRGLLDLLMHENLITREESAVILDLIPLLNGAVHGEVFSERSFYWAMDIGPRILDSLNNRIKENKRKNV